MSITSKNILIRFPHNIIVPNPGTFINPNERKLLGCCLSFHISLITCNERPTNTFEFSILLKGGKN